MSSPTTTTTSGRGLWVGVALGTPLLALTLADALADADDTHPAELAGWIVGGVLVADLVVVPGALAVGRMLRASPRTRWLRWPLAATATLALVAWPFVRGYGRSEGNPSLLPRDYGTGLALATVSVWLVAGLAAVVRRRASRPIEPAVTVPGRTARPG